MDMKFTHISYDIQRQQMILDFLFIDSTYKGEPNKRIYITWEDGDIVDIYCPDDRILEYIRSQPQDMVLFLASETMDKLVYACRIMLEREWEE